jgi:hypothetical protein
MSKMNRKGEAKMKILQSILILAMLAMFGISVQAQQPEKSMILSLSFDDGRGTKATDSSGYGNHGELKGDPKWVDGKFGKALELDGKDDYVQVLHSKSLNVDKEVTVMAWIYAKRFKNPDALGGQWQGIIAKGDTPWDKRSYSFYTVYTEASKVLQLHFSTAGVNTTSTGTVPLNEWVHVAVVVEGGQHKYYINGESAGVDGSVIKLPGTSDAADLVVGNTHEGGREFLGKIDEVRIWNNALRKDEIKSEMNRTGTSTAVKP